MKELFSDYVDCAQYIHFAASNYSNFNSEAEREGEGKRDFELFD